MRLSHLSQGQIAHKSHIMCRTASAVADLSSRSTTPRLGRREFPLPNAASSAARPRLIAQIASAVAHIGHRPALSDELAPQVSTIDPAGGDKSSIAIPAIARASDLAAPDYDDSAISGEATAGLIRAKLV